MGIKEAIKEFKQALETSDRFDVFMLGECVGSALHFSHTDVEGEHPLMLYYAFYPRAPSGIFPIGDIAVDFEEGLVYMFDGKEGEIEIDYERPVNIIEAIAKEL